MRKRKLAVFDIDGTIFRSSLLIELVQALIQEKLFPSTAKRTYQKEYEAWLDRTGDYEAYIGGVVRAFEKYIKGVRAKDFVRVAKHVAASHEHRVYRYTRDLILELRRKNYYLLAISHSPKYIVESFAKQLGFTKTYGRILEIDSRGCFTGKILYEDMIRDKKKILKRFLEKEQFSLRGSLGVGDSESDIPFLLVMDRAICFNPNRALYRFARKRKWEVVVERKDVTYHLP